MKIDKRKVLLAAVTLTSSMLMAVVVIAAGVNDVNACVNKRTGDVRVLNFLGGACKGGETSMTWNKQGVQGIQGNQGIKGDTGEQGPIGLTGPQGIQGEVGPVGPSGSQVIDNVTYFDGQYTDGNGGTFIANTGDRITASATCPEGKVLFGGGGYVRGFGVGHMRTTMQESYPSNTTWTVSGVVLSSFGVPSTSHTMEARAYVICSL